MKRSAGILLPLFSVPSPYGIGTMGEEARHFIRFLKRAKQQYWQILPIGPTSYGDSPYQSFSSYAGNPYFIDFDELEKIGLLEKCEYESIDWGNPNDIDYGLMYEKRYDVLRKACNRLCERDQTEFHLFETSESAWLHNYALFMAIKQSLGGIALSNWPDEIRRRNPEKLAELEEKLKDEILFWKQLQFLFFQQWNALKKYANENGIQMIGDLPIYVAGDSAEVWANPEQFQLDQNGKPTEVAGCPPDGFSPDGQLWGNPLFDWEKMKEENYQWWVKRIAHQTRFYDVLRIDHFRGFASYFAIPAGDSTAHNGRWVPGPGIDLFRTIEDQLGKINIIAEDLGFLTQDVIDMVNETGYPGMKVLEFAFDARDTGSGYLPHCYERNCIVYAGTHDNDTIIGWMQSAPKDNVQRAIDYLHLDQNEGYHWGMIRSAYMSVADTAIIQFQDFMGLDNSARINVPSTTGKNWKWRCNKEDFKDELADKLALWMEFYGRIPQ